MIFDRNIPIFFDSQKHQPNTITFTDTDKYNIQYGTPITNVITNITLSKWANQTTSLYSFVLCRNVLSYQAWFSPWSTAGRWGWVSISVSFYGGDNHFLFLLYSLANLKHLQQLISRLHHRWRQHPEILNDQTLLSSSSTKHRLCTQLLLFFPTSTVCVWPPWLCWSVAQPPLYPSLWRNLSHHASGDIVWDSALTCHIMLGPLWRKGESEGEGKSGKEEEKRGGGWWDNHMGCPDNSRDGGWNR